MTENSTRVNTADPEEPSPRREPLRVSFSVPQIIGGALAAATAAALGSSLGVAGTVIGASVASVIGGVAGTLYAAGIDRTHRSVSAAIKRGYDRIKVVEPSDEETVATAEGMPEAPDAEEVEIAVTAPIKAPAARRQLWLRMGLSALAIFAISAVVVTVIELTVGRALDGSTGTTVGQVTRPHPQPTVTVTVAPTTAPTPEPTTTSSQPTPEPTATSTQTPTTTPSSSPAAAPATPQPTQS